MMGLKIGDLYAPVPVIQGGMGVGVSLSSLAGSVAKAGGIGIISTAQIGYRDPDFDRYPIPCNLKAIGEEINKAREIADGGIVGVNIMVATRQYEDYVKAAADAGADLIISGAGLPMTLPAVAPDSRLAPIVSSEKSLQVILHYWQKKYNRKPDLVVIEGPKAGGHLGFSREEIDSYTVTGNQHRWQERRSSQRIMTMRSKRSSHLQKKTICRLSQQAVCMKERIWSISYHLVQMVCR